MPASSRQGPTLNMTIQARCRADVFDCIRTSMAYGVRATGRICCKCLFPCCEWPWMLLAVCELGIKSGYFRSFMHNSLDNLDPLHKRMILI